MSIKKNFTNFLISRGILDFDTIKGKSFTMASKDPFILWKTSKKMPVAKIMREYRGWTFAASRSIAEAIANIEITLNKVNSDGTKERIFDHDLLDDLYPEWGDNLLCARIS